MGDPGRPLSRKELPAALKQGFLSSTFSTGSHNILRRCIPMHIMPPEASPQRHVHDLWGQV